MGATLLHESSTNLSELQTPSAASAAVICHRGRQQATCCLITMSLCTAEALQLALVRISSLITGLCEAGKSLQTSELHALELLVEGLHLYNDCHQAQKLCR